MSDRIDTHEGARAPSPVDGRCAILPEQRVTWLLAIGIALFIFGAPALFRSSSFVQLPFDDKPVKQLKRLRPECVVVGDSMLGSRVDPATLSKVSDIPCAVLAYPGSGTAMWYLLAKNVVAAQTPPPRWLVIFFRDKQLTMPAHRAGERFREGLEMCMQGDEPHFRSILSHARHDTASWTERFTSSIYTVQRKRKDWQTKVQYGALKAVASQPERAPVREATAHIFKPVYTRAEKEFNDARDGEISLGVEDHEFQANVAQSFLPAILDVADRSHIRLLFYRVKRRPKDSETPAVERPHLQKYVHELREYLTARGALLVDETTDPDVGFQYYAGDDHVREEMMAPYTELFWSKVGPLLEGAKPAPAHP